MIAYMLGSHKDRDTLGFWRWLFPLAVCGLLLFMVVDAYRRTTEGKPWRRSPDEARR